MDAPGEEGLARAGLAHDQDGRVGHGHAVDHGDDVAHPLALAHDVVVHPAALGLLPGELAVHPAVLGRAQDQVFQVLGLEGLGHVMESPELGRLHGALDGAHAGHDDHRRVRVGLAHGLEQLDAIHARHGHVRDDDVEQGLLHGGQRRLTRSHGLDLEVAVGKIAFQDVQEIRLVVHDQ